MSMYPISYLFGFNQFKDGAWYEPSWDDRIEWMMRLLDLHPGDRAIDIGSGDGRVVLAMAQRGVEACGIEKDKKLVKLSRELINAAHLTESAHIIEGDFWDFDFHTYNKVAVYQINVVMQRLEEKLLRELPSPSVVVSNYWKFPNWKVSDQEGDVYQYRKQ